MWIFFSSFLLWFQQFYWYFLQFWYCAEVKVSVYFFNIKSIHLFFNNHINKQRTRHLSPELNLCSLFVCLLKTLFVSQKWSNNNEQKQLELLPALAAWRLTCALTVSSVSYSPPTVTHCGPARVPSCRSQSGAAANTSPDLIGPLQHALAFL